MHNRSVLLLFTLLLAAGCHRAPPPKVSLQTPSSQVTENAHQGRWIRINSRSETLTVMQDSTPIRTFENIAWGVAGVGEKQKRGDGITPKGEFHITVIASESKFHAFLGIDYPTPAYAENALRHGRISQKTYKQILEAHERHQIPPQNTELGGNLGIHGVGRGNVLTHRLVNWTGGCVALENQQIDELLHFAQPGMVVEIR